MRSLQLVKEDKNGNHRHREKATGLFILKMFVTKSQYKMISVSRYL